MRKAFLHIEFSLGGGTVGADTIFDGHHALHVLAQRSVNDPLLCRYVAVDDGKVFFDDGAGFPEFAQFAGRYGVFGKEDDTAGFAVEPVNEMRGG